MPVTDIDNARPVALLARPGQARERLREAVVQAGGYLVLEDDPTTLDAQSLHDAGPSVVLVALEPAIEDALERLDAALDAPQLTLIFDEADLAARREGWEAQRWIRHLSAKLHGHDNVLPPGHEVETTLQPEPGLPPTPEQLHSGASGEFLIEEAADAAYDLPADTLYAPSAEPAPLAFDTVESFEPVRPAAVPPPLPPLEEIPPQAAPAPAVPGFSAWSLVEDDAYVAPPPAAPAATDPVVEFSTDLSLVDLEPVAEGPVGMVLVLAGIGGPDAVRRLLSALPETFDRAVLVQLRLDGGRYGNLVKQIARVTPLPVSLAEVGQPVQGGQVYILPDDVGVALDNGAGVFSAGTAAAVVSSLPAASSAVLMLSGADQAQVEDVLALAEQGAWVAGQVGEACYDPAAASRLAVAGMPSGDPPALAQALCEHWGV